MRDDRKIERYKRMREDSRYLFMRTGNREHLEDMFTLKRMIEAEMNKESRVLGKVLLGMGVATVLSPFIIYFFVR